MPKHRRRGHYWGPRHYSVTVSCIIIAVSVYINPATPRPCYSPYKVRVDGRIVYVLQVVLLSKGTDEPIAVREIIVVVIAGVPP